MYCKHIIHNVKDDRIKSNKINEVLMLCLVFTKIQTNTEDYVNIYTLVHIKAYISYGTRMYDNVYT